MKNRHKQSIDKSIIASSITGLLTATSASAAVNPVSGIEIAFIDNLGNIQDISWDVDGNGTFDMFITGSFNTGSVTAIFGFSPPGGAFVRNGDDIEGLDSQLLVGSTGVMGAPYNFDNRNAGLTFYTSGGYFTGDSNQANVDLSETPSIIGFQFQREDENIPGQFNTHYGVANITAGINSDRTVASITISNWAWEDLPDTPILASKALIPEPSQTAALLGLAAGAAGLMRWRRSKHKLTKNSELN